MDTTTHKALAAGIVALLGALAAALDHGLTGGEVLAALGIGFTAYAATWRVPYHRRRSERRGHRRHP